MFTNNKPLKVIVFILLLIVVVILSGCGGTVPPVNHSPVISGLTVDSSSVDINQTTIITCYASDPDRDTLTYIWTKTGGTISGSGSTITWTAPSTAGTYIITCTVSDGKLIDIQGISITVLEPEPENQAPVITSTAVTSVIVGEAYTYPVIAIDANDDDLTYSLIPLTDFVTAGMNINAGTGVITWIPTAVGSFGVTVQVSDGELTDTQSFTIVVTEPEPVNQLPVISSLTTNSSSIDINQSSTITCNAYDPDGDYLTFSWTKTGGTISGSVSIITWTAPNIAGTYTITCTVSDGHGGEDSESVNIAVNDLGSVPSVSAVAVTYHLYRGKEQSIINKLVKEDKIHRSNPIIKSEKVDKSGITYAIYVEWAKFNEASGYKIYRSVNWTAFKLVYTEEVSSDYEWYSFWDNDTQIGNIYSYYVIAYGPFGETVPDKIVSIDTWLPPCSLISPLDMTTITNPNPTFTWSPVGISAFPYGTIYSAESDLWVYDEADEEISWWILFDNLLSNTAIYNQDGEAIPLTYGHNYRWNSWGYGYDINSDLIAASESEDWEFYYREYEPVPNNPPIITSNANTSAIMGVAYTYDVDATDPDGDVLTYSLTGPSGMDIDPATGIITWTPTAAGTFSIIVSVSDGELTDTQSFAITVTTSSVNIVYRALCVGVGDYLYFPDACGNVDLPAPPYDVDRMRQTLGYCKFGLTNIEFSTILYLKNGQATKSNILQSIASVFSGANSNDISYFYFSGHGMRYENKSYLCPVNITCYSPLNSYISVGELETALSAIPGTKVVFLDSCYSGGFIGKGKEEENKIIEEKLTSFNEDVINIFSLVESRGLLTSNKYKVLTSCHYYQMCYEIDPTEEDPFGVFTTALCEGCGYYGSYPADTNSNTKVSLQEAYLYIHDWVQDYFGDLQDVQVYPSNSTFTIAEY